jgi:hypothetical protein
MNASDLDGVPAVARGEHCPPPDALASLGGDALPADLRAAVEQHVAACPVCRALAADHEAIADDAWTPEVEARLAARLPQAGATGRTHLRGWGPWLAAAALVVLAIGLVSTRDARPRQATVAVQTPSRPSPSRPLAFAIDVPDLRVPVAEVLVMRGASSVHPLVAVESAWRAGDFARVTAALAPAAETRPDDRAIAFYLGASRLLADDPGAAREPLERAVRLSSGADANEAQWYLAAAEQRSGAAPAATTRLDALCLHDGPYRLRACAAAAEARQGTLGR